MIQAVNISYKAGDKSLLQDISATFKAGVFNLIIGPNGAGKSTLIKIISGQLPAYSGQLLYGEMPVSKYPVAELAKVRAVLSQNLEISFPLKVWEVVMMGRYPHFAGKPGKKDNVACNEAMQLFAIDSLADRDYTTLSGGEKQRVHFARVMSQIWYPVKDKCRYLLLDEPLTFLDVHYQYQFMYQIQELLKADDLVVIGVVHDLNLAIKFAGHLVLLHNGNLLASGNTESVMTLQNIKTAYHVEPEMVQHKDKRYLFF
jgi:iron complex transport system ATP-binding protein